MATYKELRNSIREVKKDLIEQIRKNKKEGYRHCPQRHQFRIMHIAYCEYFRGKTRDNIEKPCEQNELSPYSESQIENLKAGWASEIKLSEPENA